MMKLPEDFIRETRLVMGEARFNRFIGAFDEEAPTSIRLNPRLLRSEECGVWSENTPAADQTTPCPSYSGGENTLQGNHNSQFSILNLTKSPGVPKAFTSPVALSSPSTPSSMPAATTSRKPPRCSSPTL